ncbi:MAG TPA: cytochrome P450 [Sneathiellales bacterium]|nr:cytochrome P450 [Sneathiellales bacterium]
MVQEWSNTPYRPHPPAHMGLFERLKHLRTNFIYAWTANYYAQPFVVDRGLTTTFIVVTKPEYVKHVLVNNHENYVKSSMQQATLVPLVGHGLLTSDGEFWRRQRRIMQPAFHYKRLQTFASTMTGAADEMLVRWQASKGNGEVLDVSTEMAQVTLDIICRTMFGSGIDRAQVDAVRDASAIIAQDLGTPPYADLLGLPRWFPRRLTRRVRRAIGNVQRLIEKIIVERRDNGEGGHDDLLEMLLSVRDEETGEGMTDEQLRDEVITVFLAGHDTTANSLGWAWYLLSQHPEVEARLDEVENGLGGRLPVYEDLAKLPYTKMIFEEALRLYPPAPAFMREAIAEDQVGDLRIPAGAQVTIAPWLSHRHRELWDRPDDFVPERFAPENSKDRHRYAYIPFGGGPRICIGNAFAMMEGPLILATIAQRYRLRLVEGHIVEPQSKITLWPKNGLRMTLEPAQSLPEAAD